MLRRLERNDSFESWVLVPQIEHAWLSGGLAETWAAPTLAKIEPHDELIEAIGLHDDGWAEWDSAPDVDPVSGRPLSFVEMPLEAATTIWRRSIDLAAEQGPLAAHVVSAHFNALLQQAAPRWSVDPRQFQLSREFLNEQSEQREIWFMQWQRENPSVRTRRMVDQALAYLQFFDRLSLWLCAAPRSEPELFATPDGTEVVFEPRDSTHFTVRPWPLTVDRLTWTMTTRRVPVRHYASRAALAATPGEPNELRFKLTAAP
ncbi:MAG TPA: DUF3891 family protein [Pirellulales bacterium]|jgi:hypothetical protein